MAREPTSNLSSASRLLRTGRHSWVRGGAIVYYHLLGYHLASDVACPEVRSEQRWDKMDTLGESPKHIDLTTGRAGCTRVFNVWKSHMNWRVLLRTFVGLQYKSLDGSQN